MKSSLRVCGDVVGCLVDHIHQNCGKVGYHEDTQKVSWEKPHLCFLSMKVFDISSFYWPDFFRGKLDELSSTKSWWLSQPFSRCIVPGTLQSARSPQCTDQDPGDLCPPTSRGGDQSVCCPHLRDRSKGRTPVFRTDSSWCYQRSRWILFFSRNLYLEDSLFHHTTPSHQSYRFLRWLLANRLSWIK